MALQSNGIIFLDDNKNFSAQGNTVLANDAFILIANNDSVSGDGYAIIDEKSIADDGFDFNQFNSEEFSISFSIFNQAQGQSYGYSSAGSPTLQQSYERFPFATNSNATEIGDLTKAREKVAGQSSSIAGYTCGGFDFPDLTNIVDKFPFSSGSNATDVGDLTVANWEVAGQSSRESGYTSGGHQRSTTNFYDIISKFPFTADTNATDVGDLTQARMEVSGQMSSEFGYTSGGRTISDPSTGVLFTTIDKFPFTADANATDVGDLTAVRTATTGQSSPENGYVTGGSTSQTSPVTVTLTTIEKFPFASDSSTSDVGDLSQGVNRAYASGQSSEESGYTSGGGYSPGSVNIIDKFPFASDANATDVGDLNYNRRGPAGQQV